MPASALLALAAAALAAAVALFATGAWPLGLVLAGIALLLCAAFAEAARHKPDGRAAERSLAAVRGVRERGAVALESLAVRTQASRELTLHRRELLRLHERRRALVAALGEAALAEDAAPADDLKQEIRELEQLVRHEEATMETIAAHARERVAQARLPIDATVMVEAPDGPDEADPPPPEYPPPDEGTPPEPARIPEPYPPDEITPPQASDRRAS